MTVSLSSCMPCTEARTHLVRRGLRVPQDVSVGELHDVALAVAIDLDTGIELAHLCQEMGRLAFRTGDNQGAVDWAGRAQLAEPICSPNTRFFC